jgi:aspartyl-tRNA(Asn)/glutamyl-tRNA(Gln) amidotransferase subunit B
MELVTEPVIHNAKDASDFAKELQLLLRYLEVSDANMEKGEMRVEANVSIAKEGELGTKVEIKNLNSFKSVERAIAFEITRQEEVIEGGGTVVQETRGWDDANQKTFSQRKKEESYDYRYFPDPDLPKLKLSEIEEFNESRLGESIRELPDERRNRILKEYGLNKNVIETLVQDLPIKNFFDTIESFLKDDKGAISLAANYITSDIVGFLAKDSSLSLNKIEGASFASLIRMIQAGTISSRGAKSIIAILLKEGGDSEKIAEEHNFVQRSDENELVAIVNNILKEYPDISKEYKAGKESSLQFLVGQAMKLSKGTANPQLLQKLFKEQLS